MAKKKDLLFAYQMSSRRIKLMLANVRLDSVWDKQRKWVNFGCAKPKVNNMTMLEQSELLNEEPNVAGQCSTVQFASLINDYPNYDSN